MLVLFTDTDTDITPAVAAEYGYHLISMPYSVEGKDVYPYEDFERFDAHAFYETLRLGVLPHTSAIAPERYKAYFEPVLQNGDDILYVHFSAAMTATFDNMAQAVRELKEQYPDRTVYAVDTKGITLCSYAVVRAVGEKYKQGATAEELIAFAKEEAEHTATYFFADDLRFFHRSGRVGGLAATMGSIVGVRPIICMNDEGKMVSVGKERGRANAVDRLIATVKELGDDLSHHRVYVGNADADDLADEVIARLRAETDAADIEKVTVNPTAGSHCGPDTVGVCFHAIHR